MAMSPSNRKTEYNPHATPFVPSADASTLVLPLLLLPTPAAQPPMCTVRLLNLPPALDRQQIDSWIALVCALLEYPGPVDVTDVVEAHGSSSVVLSLAYLAAPAFVDALTDYVWKGYEISVAIESYPPVSTPFFSWVPYYPMYFPLQQHLHLQPPQQHHLQPNSLNLPPTPVNLPPNSVNLPPFILNMVNDTLLLLPLPIMQSRGFYPLSESAYLPLGPPKQLRRHELASLTLSAPFDSRGPSSRNSSVSLAPELMIQTEEGMVKVNPHRLFVGNIPFTSTWIALKSFLVKRCEEIEPKSGVDIHRVEIPMQPQNFDDKRPERAVSRGFAIVTTDLQELLRKLIKWFDDVEFEGRKITVRFDRFPDYNNHFSQQIYLKVPQFSGQSLLSNLAYERSLYQKKFYYNNHMSMMYPQYYVLGTLAGPNYRYEGPLLVHEFDLASDLDQLNHHDTPPSETIHTPTEAINDDERARELVNLFNNLDLA